jgi:hypothetical protein
VSRSDGAIARSDGQRKSDDYRKSDGLSKSDEGHRKEVMRKGCSKNYPFSKGLDHPFSSPFFITLCRHFFSSLFFVTFFPLVAME